MTPWTGTWRRIHDAEPMFALGAYVDGKLLGIVQYLFHRSFWTTGDYCYLQDLFVAKETRGLGLGRALIEAVYERAKAHGASRVHWLTQEGNATARLLYDNIADRPGLFSIGRFSDLSSFEEEVICHSGARRRREQDPEPLAQGALDSGSPLRGVRITENSSSNFRGDDTEFRALHSYISITMHSMTRIPRISRRAKIRLWPHLARPAGFARRADGVCDRAALRASQCFRACWRVAASRSKRSTTSSILPSAG